MKISLEIKSSCWTWFFSKFFNKSSNSLCFGNAGFNKSHASGVKIFSSYSINASDITIGSLSYPNFWRTTLTHLAFSFDKYDFFVDTINFGAATFFFISFFENSDSKSFVSNFTFDSSIYNLFIFFFYFFPYTICISSIVYFYPIKWFHCNFWFYDWFFYIRIIKGNYLELALFE